ncbi:MAG: hypothetical protein A4E48_00223 [Methanosaeta sp. PtaU1.Bin060]|nr:MAG: hypothetical protein A4E48_00223 [Methanosaeta sp. PtaU1.Bin060]
MGKQSDDFGELMVQTCLVQPFIRNDGYKDIFGEGVIYPCIIETKIFRITKTDGTITTTTAQVYLDADAVVTIRDKVTFGGVSPKILKVATDHDIESPEDVYGIIIYT